ncbi:MAG: prolyl oligopeptidase family serine peptidase [Planctomycetes bacterium]|nr:prolyl oligopeptidase family serine peptidase [Planctomycetota bacterium]
MTDLQTTETTQYGRTRINLRAGEVEGFVILPAEGGRGGRPWLWYAPSFMRDPYPLPKDLHAWYLQPVLESGIAVAGVDVGESWGSPAGRALFTRFHALVTERFGLDRRACLMPQSRGGLMHYNWAAEHPDCVRCIGAIYPVCDMKRPIRLEKVAAAYGLTPGQLLAEAHLHHPIDRVAPLAEHRVPILHIHGDQDEVVPLASNSQALIDRYRALGGPGEVIVVAGKGHAEVPEFFQNRRMLEFYLTLGENLGPEGRCGAETP